MPPAALNPTVAGLLPTAAAIPAAPSPARMGAGIVGCLCYWWVTPIVDVSRDSTVGSIE